MHNTLTKMKDQIFKVKDGSCRAQTNIWINTHFSIVFENKKFEFKKGVGIDHCYQKVYSDTKTGNHIV